MVEYIYFVKCNNCDDEMFNFFDEAKEFAASRLSKKPVITQTEVIRNDFGECVDSCNLGTVWSWEELMSDIPDVKPEETVFTKADTFDSTDWDVAADLKDVPDDVDGYDFFTKEPVKRTLDETYYAVIDVDGEERKFPFESRDEARRYINYVKAGKDPAFAGKEIGSIYTESCNKRPMPADMTIESLVEEIEEHEDTVECKRCNELFPKHDCHNEVTRGWLCPLCIMDLDAAGEDLEFKRAAAAEDLRKEKETVELYYDELEVTIFGEQRDADDWDEKEFTTDYTYEVNKDDVITFLWESCLTDEDLILISEGAVSQADLDALTVIECSDIWEDRMNKFFDDLFNKYEKQILDYFEDEATEACQDETSYYESYPDHRAKVKEAAKAKVTKSMLEELEDPAEYRARLFLCPECGEYTFDVETGICISCGYSTLEEDLSDTDIKNIANITKRVVERETDELLDRVNEVGNTVSIHHQVISKGLDSLQKDN